MNRGLALLTPAIPAMVVVGFFVWFANWIPQTHWDPPKKLDLGTQMTPADLAQAGATIVRERGCMACHTLEPGRGVQGGGRGPNLDGVAERRAQGVPGGPGTLVDYLAQSLYEPGAHLVEGYMNIMPAATAAPAKLGYNEIVAVVDYLQSLGGTPSVSIGDLPQPAQAGTAAVQATPAPVTAAGGAELLTALGCFACHSEKPGETVLGPALDGEDLRQIAAQRGLTLEAYLLEAIVDPGAFQRPDYPAGVMPADYGTTLSAAQLKAVVDYLARRDDS
ncbi:MAG: c-type cytochrome [Gammaproteobacteria bacterium]|nr:c-type cytochrome [Gammaproteobacteria bacterium]